MQLDHKALRNNAQTTSIQIGFLTIQILFWEETKMRYRYCRGHRKNSGRTHDNQGRTIKGSRFHNISTPLDKKSFFFERGRNPSGRNWKNSSCEIWMRVADQQMKDSKETPLNGGTSFWWMAFLKAQREISMTHVKISNMHNFWNFIPPGGWRWEGEQEGAKVQQSGCRDKISAGCDCAHKKDRKCAPTVSTLRVF